MNAVNYRVTLDLFDAVSQTTIKAKKGDSACKIHITLAKNGKIFNIGEGCYATFNAKKSDGNFIYDNCTIEGDTIVYDFSSSVDENGACQVSAIEGNVECEVTLYNAQGEQLTSPRFTLYIDSVIYNGEEIASSPEADVLKGLVVEAKETIAEMEDKLEDAENYRSTVSNALKKSVTGSALLLEQVSPITHIVDANVIENISARVAVFGGNILPKFTGLSAPGVSWWVDEGKIIPRGTPTEYSGISVSLLKLNYTTPLTFALYGDAQNVHAQITIDGVVKDVEVGSAITISADEISQAKTISVALCRIKDNVEMSGYLYPMLNIGNKALPFEQYVEPKLYYSNSYGKFTEIESVYPNTSIILETDPDLNLNATYSVDLNKAFENIGNVPGGGEQGGSDIFIAEYGKTTFAEIQAEHQSGKIVCCMYGDATGHLVGLDGNYAQFVYHRSGTGITTLYCSAKNNAWSQKTEAVATMQYVDEAVENIDLTEPINSALTEAKESGDFTPQKGVDYFTEEEKQEIVDEVLDGLPESGGGEWQLLKEITVEAVTGVEEIIEGIELAKEFIIYVKAKKQDVKIVLGGTLTLTDKKGFSLYYYYAITNGNSAYPSGESMRRFTKIGDGIYLKESVKDVTAQLGNAYGNGSALNMGIVGNTEAVITNKPKGTLAIGFTVEVETATIKVYGLM